MNTDKVTAEERLNFIHLMTNAKKSSEQKKRIDSCLKDVEVSERRYKGKFGQEVSFESNRKKHRPDVTAIFLALLGVPSELKFLTHDFDPNSDMSMTTVIGRANEIINSKEYRFKIPGSLYVLFSRFINGGDTWTDYKGIKHSFYLNSEKLTNWIQNSPNIHPVASDELVDEINMFRNTVRISKPNLDCVFKLLQSNDTKLKNLRIQTEKLYQADFYTNVFWMTFMIFKKVMNDIAQRDECANIHIKFERSAWNEFRLCTVRITHIGSEANPFEETKQKLRNAGGALFNLMSSCVGYCDWMIEADFEGELKRWRILNFRDLPEEEALSADEIEGFSHIFTFYKKT